MRQCDIVRLQRAVKAFDFTPVAAATVELLRQKDAGLNHISSTSIRRQLMKCFTAGVDAVLTDDVMQHDLDLARAGGPAV